MVCCALGSEGAFALHAAGLGAVVTADMAPSHPQLAVAQRKLQGSCSALASVEGFLHSSVTAALAAAVVQVGPSMPCPFSGYDSKQYPASYHHHLTISKRLPWNVRIVYIPG